MAETASVVPWAAWRPAEYLQEYCRKVEPDDEAALRFQLAVLRRGGRFFPRALEYGCGPTLMRAIAASAYVGSLDMADRLPGNLQHVRRWLAGEPGADDWSPFTEYVLRCEGIAVPSADLVRSRERSTRRVVSDLLLTDARRRHPLGRARAASYDLLISGFCLDCISHSKAVWQRCMANVFRLLKPRASFVLLALRGCRAYRVGSRWFPAANLSREELESALFACGADPASTDLRECELPGHAGQGYRGVLLAGGETTA
jgi:hypothetical protein